MFPDEMPEDRVAIVVTDIEGSTSLWERLGLAFADALQVHDRVLRALVEPCGGYEVRTEGDAFVLVFPTAASAVRYCLQAQVALAEADWPPALLESHPRGLRVRMGVHVGAVGRARDPVSGRWTFTGPAVHRAERVGAAAHGGQILLDETAVPGAQGQGQPRPLGRYAVDGADGVVELYQILPGTLEDRRFPPPRAVQLRRGNLSPPPTAILGREAETRQVLAALERSRCVSLLGPGGVGKTRLAKHVALQRPGAQETAWFVDASDCDSHERLLATAAEVLDLSVAAPMRKQILDRLGREPTLLVLDNLEQVPDPGAIVADWLSVPTLRVLVTTRIEMGVAGEEAIWIDPLPMPDGSPDNPALQLFAERAQAVLPGFALHDGNVEVVSQLVRRLDALPLAIELAAARMAVLSPEKLLARLERRFDLLRSTHANLPSRQNSLLVAIEGSWSLLRPAEQATFAQCSVFRGSFTPEAAAAVVDLSEHPGAEVEGCLDRLVRSSLIRRREGGALRMFESLQRFAHDRLGEAAPVSVDAETLPATLAAERRHEAYYARFGEEEAVAALYRHGGGAHRQALRAHLPNLVSAAERALARGDGSLAATLAFAVSHVTSSFGPIEEGTSMVRRALAMSLPPLHRARLLERLGSQLTVAGHLGEAVEQLDEAVALARGQHRLEAVARLRRSETRRMRADVAGATEDVLRGLELARTEGPAVLVPALLNVRARVELHRGAWEEARQTLGEVRKASAEIGDTFASAVAGANLAGVELQRGHARQALALYAEALDEVRSTSVLTQEGRILSNMASCLLRLGEIEAARARLGEARIALLRVGQVQGVWQLHLPSCQAALAAGDAAAAEAEARLAIEEIQRMGDPQWESVMRYVHAQALVDLRRTDEATEAAREALRVAERLGDPHVLHLCRAQLAELEGGEGALEVIEAALCGLREVGAWADVVWVLLRLARVAGSRPERRAEALSEADRLCDELRLGAGAPQRRALEAIRRACD